MNSLIANFLYMFFEGYEKGNEFAKNIKIGDIFLGAMPEAIAAGYKVDSPGYKGFIEGYLEIVEKLKIVTVDESGLILSL